MTSRENQRLIDGKYRILRPIGEGGMGVVYEARHVGTGRRVAVKEITDESPRTNAESIARFQREARATGTIETQHIAQVLDTGTDPETGHPYLVMEFLVGEDVQQLVQRVGPLSPDLALRIVAQACVGLARAHDAGIIHRDVKPANLFLAKRDEGEIVVKLLDFGIAKVNADQLSELANAGITKTGAMLGSPLYMSPEQAQGAKNIDARTDVWSLGVVLYELLSGRTPNGHIPTMGSLILAICSEPAAPLQNHSPWVTPEQAAIVHRALWLDPAGRFGTIQEMLDALRALLSEGWRINEALLRGVPNEVKSFVAPKLPLVENRPPPLRMSSKGAGDPSALVPTLDQSGASRPGTTTGGLATAESMRGAARHRRRLGALVAAALLAAGGALAYQGLTRVKSGSVASAQAVRPAEEPRALGAGATAPSSPATIAPVAQAEATSASAPASEWVVRVRVPGGAQVEVDGVPTTVVGDSVTLKGPLGSKHAVHVAAGSRQAYGDVFVTESGAVPDRVDLPAAPPTPKPAAAGTSVQGTPQIKTTFQ